jgi:hypothetical protein
MQDNRQPEIYLTTPKEKKKKKKKKWRAKEKKDASTAAFPLFMQYLYHDDSQQWVKTNVDQIDTDNKEGSRWSGISSSLPLCSLGFTFPGRTVVYY